ncbi:uncharacterized protein LOC130497759 [Raphanus sativus]|uniref:Uncharacterized protein LOC130497759 n=1 Tax=Raphanus sativus TaxID=3726 RepID=A0A9W3C5W7_RAPSA|nr:uncharacterized protein LOC130497759 [Raphanus sativus]
MNNLLIVLTFLGLCISLSNGNKVKFSNELEHNKLLKVRCDNDEREHLLKIGEEYEFTFNDDFFHKCAMYQGPNNFEHHQEFTAINQKCDGVNEIYVSQAVHLLRSKLIPLSSINTLFTSIHHLFHNDSVSPTIIFDPSSFKQTSAKSSRPTQNPPTVILVTTVNTKRLGGTLVLSSMTSSRVFMDYDVQPTIDYFAWLGSNPEIAKLVNAAVV